MKGQREMRHCIFCIAAMATLTTLSYDNDPFETINDNSSLFSNGTWTHGRQTLGGSTAFDHSDGSTTYARQTLGGLTVYENSSGAWTHERQTLGGLTAFDHSDGSTTYARQTLGGSTLYENTSGYTFGKTETFGSYTPVQRQGVVFDSQPRTQTFGGSYNQTHHDAQIVPIIQHRRGSNENNPFGGGYSGDPFRPHGNFLR